jgi:hypothetical protein
MRKIALAGAAALIASVGTTGAASAASDGVTVREQASGVVVTPAAWRGGWWGPRFRGGVFFGPSIGFGVYSPLWVPPPVYYAPPRVVVQQGYVAPPASYAPPAAGYSPQADDGSYWYYCSNPQGYYPYVRQCTGQWETVPATPDAGQAPR